MSIIYIEIPDEQIEKVISRMMQIQEPNSILTTDEAAKELGVSVQTINKYTKMGILPATHKKGVRTKLFLNSDVQSLKTKS